ncbi:transposase [Actinoplanes sp. CA-142083]|uniref:transposase n=1 Tax=Actinoplanes sp. CA-142083 TaxID=3239903 RepID=UPI003D8B8C32
MRRFVRRATNRHPAQSYPDQRRSHPARSITRAVTAAAPALLDQHGVGPSTAAALLLAAGDNPHRINTEAKFAALCGTNPIEASSGKTHRRRLNRGGDRQANRALYTIALCRLSNHQPTRDYMTRRIHEGKTKREIIRCLKRAIARQLHPLITQPPKP